MSYGTYMTHMTYMTHITYMTYITYMHSRPYKSYGAHISHTRYPLLTLIRLPDRNKRFSGQPASLIHRPTFVPRSVKRL
jgi:hypothetical protein